MSKIFVIGVDVKFGTQEHGAEFFEDGDNAEKFFFDGRVVLLRWVQFPRVEGNWFAILENCRSELIITSVGVDVERFVMVRVSEEDVRRHHLFHLFEGFLVTLFPNKLLSC